MRCVPLQKLTTEKSMTSHFPDSAEVTQTIERFRKFLVASWPAFQAILHEHDWDNDAYFLEDWIDSNWQLLVGRPLFGNEVKIQPMSASTNDIKKKKYKLCLRSESPIVGTFISLGTLKEGFSLNAPFDMVRILTDSGTEEVLPLFSVTCWTSAVRESS
jgi:hypothetical protein